MIPAVGRHARSAVVLLVALAGCATLWPQERHALHGPTAEEIWMARVLLATAHEPSFDDRQRWDDQMDQRLSQYLSRHPRLANSIDVTSLTMTRQVTVGMERELVLLLLGPPVLGAKEAAEIEKLARGYWPLVKVNKPTEAWLYPQGWRLFLDDARIVDITQYLEP